MTTNTTFARDTGIEMAEYLNDHPAEAQNWRPMVAGDDIPTEDYVTLCNHYGFNDMEQDEISEVERAYRAGFNSAFVECSPADAATDAEVHEVALHTTSGLIQYAESIETMLAEYNRNGRFYEIHTDTAGNQVLWHKGHNYSVGTFQASDRV